MDREDFTESAPGSLVTSTIQGTETPAFVPDDLATIDIDQGRLVNEIGQAMRELGALDHLGPIAGSGNMLIEAFARKEAVQSSRIEGTQVTLADVYRYEAEQAVGEDSGDNEGARQAKNYLNALETGLSALESDGQVTRETLCRMHAILLDGVRSEDPSPGEPRTEQNWLAPYEGAQVSDASFVPPPPN